MEIITRDEKERLESRLKQLKSNRPRLSERIAEARAHGDISENAEYHAAKEQQGIEEAEIRRLESRLSNCQVVDGGQSAAEGVVFLGSTVRLREVGTEDEELYRLVGEANDDPGLDHVEVTATSPMGEALMKARVGETISVRAPRGVKRFLIVEIV